MGKHRLSHGHPPQDPERSDEDLPNRCLRPLLHLLDDGAHNQSLLPINQQLHHSGGEQKETLEVLGETDRELDHTEDHSDEGLQVQGVDRVIVATDWMVDWH